MVRRRTRESVLDALNDILSTTEGKVRQDGSGGTITLSGSNYAYITKSLLMDTIKQLELWQAEHELIAEQFGPEVSDSKTGS